MNECWTRPSSKNKPSEGVCLCVSRFPLVFLFCGPGVSNIRSSFRWRRVLSHRKLEQMLDATSPHNNKTKRTTHKHSVTLANRVRHSFKVSMAMCPSPSKPERILGTTGPAKQKDLAKETHTHTHTHNDDLFLLAGRVQH